jgi:hypothetical protein
VHVYFLSSLCISLCLASALELLNVLLQIVHRITDRLQPPTSNAEVDEDILILGLPEDNECTLDRIISEFVTSLSLLVPIQYYTKH